MSSNDHESCRNSTRLSNTSACFSLSLSIFPSSVLDNGALVKVAIRFILRVVSQWGKKAYEKNTYSNYPYPSTHSLFLLSASSNSNHSGKGRGVEGAMKFDNHSIASPAVFFPCASRYTSFKRNLPSTFSVNPILIILILPLFLPESGWLFTGAMVTAEMHCYLRFGTYVTPSRLTAVYLVHLFTSRAFLLLIFFPILSSDLTGKEALIVACQYHIGVLVPPN